MKRLFIIPNIFSKSAWGLFEHSIVQELEDTKYEILFYFSFQALHQPVFMYLKQFSLLQ